MALLWVILLATVAVVSTKFLDLTYGVDETTHYWIGVQTFVFTKKTALSLPDGNWYAANEFCSGEHGGTHFDAPYHFSRGGWRVGQVPIENLIVPGVIIDVSAEASSHPDFELEERHVTSFLQDHSLPDKVVVLVKFGWSQFYLNRTAYYGTDANDTSKLHFPGLSGGAARMLVDTGRVVGVGVDTPSVDKGQFNGIPIAHQTLAAANIYMLENIALNTTELPATGFTLFVMPMKILEGTGAPCRVVAVVNDVAV